MTIILLQFELKQHFIPQSKWKSAEELKKPDTQCRERNTAAICTNILLPHKDKTETTNNMRPVP